MSALASILFPAPTLRRSPLAVLRWWESRRVVYNAIVATTGVVTLLSLALVFGGSFLFHNLPWVGVLAYGIAANVCYSAGAPIEILLERWLGRQTYGLGPALFRYGLVYSIGLTLFPVGLAAFVFVARFVGHWLR